MNVLPPRIASSAAPATAATAPIGRLTLRGVGFWAPTLPGWDVARAALRGLGAPHSLPAKRPAPLLLPAAERRRAPDTVALALEVAAAAVAASGLDAATLPSVFATAHGELAITDHMCQTLATAPTLISPTKFHNSVLNAAAGYWTMGAHCHAASTAISAFEHSFANGLLAAAVQCLADAQPVLLVAYDVQAVGALASATRSDGLLGVALVLAPEDSGQPLAAFDLSLQPRTPDAGPPIAAPASAAAQALAGNAMADALPFFEALAAEPHPDLALVLSERQALQVRWHDPA